MAVDPDEAAGSSRRDFLRLAVAAGLVGPAAAGCRGSAPPADAPPIAPPAPDVLGADCVARGIAALGSAHARGWISGHHGAAVLASVWFCRDNGLDARTARALRAQVDAYIAHRPDEFPAPDFGTGRADPALIAERLDPHAGELRSGGHGTIFASLALRALRDHPEFATPAVVDGTCRLLDDFTRASAPVAPSRHHLDHPLPPYRDGGDLAATTLRAMLRPWSHLSRVGTSGVLHWITYAEALVTLEELGYGDVARRGHAAQRLQINRPVPEDEGGEPERTPVDWLGAAYWESDAPRRLLNDSWLFGHAFKLPYSLFRLLRRVDDPALRGAALARAAKLSIPFEPRG